MNGPGHRERIEAVLRRIAPDLRRHAREPLWLIGSAAACLRGVDTTAADLDLLTSEDDARRLASAWADRRVDHYRPAHEERFRSTFARYDIEPMPVEVMGGLQVCVDGDWQPLRIDEEPSSRWGDLPVLVPSVKEQLRVLALFGRAKDRRRARQLRGLEQDA